MAVLCCYASIVSPSISVCQSFAEVYARARNEGLQGIVLLTDIGVAVATMPFCTSCRSGPAS